MKKCIGFCALLVIAVSCQDTQLQEFRYSGYAQGSTYHLTLRSATDPNLKNALDSIFKAVDQSLSTYQNASLISRLNRGDTILLNEHLRQMWQQSALYFKRSEGYFDPTAGPLVAYWGFGPEEKKSVDSTALEALQGSVGFSKLPPLDGRRYAIPKAMSLDFNAIAQGYTVDLIAEFLLAKGIDNFLVEVGGELRSAGRNQDGEIWRVGIDKPQEEIDPQDRFQFILALDSAGMATSGNYRKFWVDSATGMKYAHTIDPQSGYPARNRLLSATVVAASASEADAMATAFMAMGLDKSLRYLQKADSKLEAYLVYTDEKGEWQIFTTKAMEAMILN